LLLETIFVWGWKAAAFLTERYKIRAENIRAVLKIVILLDRIPQNMGIFLPQIMYF